MSYNQLLNPKAFAKEKEKERQRDSKVKNGMSLSFTPDCRRPSPNLTRDRSILAEVFGSHVAKLDSIKSRSSPAPLIHLSHSLHFIYPHSTTTSPLTAYPFTIALQYLNISYNTIIINSNPSAPTNDILSSPFKSGNFRQPSCISTIQKRHLAEQDQHTEVRPKSTSQSKGSSSTFH